MRTITAISILAGLLGVAACGPPIPQLKAKAASDLGCSVEQITNTELNTWDRQEVTGCGKTNVYMHASGAWSSPFDRAAFDLSCPKEQLAAQRLSGMIVGVTGCGKKATYVRAQTSAGTAEWVLDGTSDPKP